MDDILKFIVLIALLVLFFINSESNDSKVDSKVVGSGDSGDGIIDLKKHVVIVDVLNISYKEKNKNNEDRISKTIEEYAKNNLTGKLIFVAKNKINMPKQHINDDEMVRLAKKTKSEIWIATDDNVHDKPHSINQPPFGVFHSSKGRDDLLMLVLAERFGNSVIVSDDNFSDATEFNRTVPPFYIRRYTYWSDVGETLTITPAGYTNIGKNKNIKFLKYKH